MKFYLNFKYFHSRKCIWTCPLVMAAILSRMRWVNIVNNVGGIFITTPCQCVTAPSPLRCVCVFVAGCYCGCVPLLWAGVVSWLCPRDIAPRPAEWVQLPSTITPGASHSGKCKSGNWLQGEDLFVTWYFCVWFDHYCLTSTEEHPSQVFFCPSLPLLWGMVAHGFLFVHLCGYGNRWIWR